MTYKEFLDMVGKYGVVELEDPPFNYVKEYGMEINLLLAHFYGNGGINMSAYDLKILGWLNEIEEEDFSYIEGLLEDYKYRHCSAHLFKFISWGREKVKVEYERRLIEDIIG